MANRNRKPIGRITNCTGKSASGGRGNAACTIRPTASARPAGNMTPFPAAACARPAPRSGTCTTAASATVSAACSSSCGRPGWRPASASAAGNRQRRIGGCARSTCWRPARTRSRGCGKRRRRHERALPKLRRTPPGLPRRLPVLLDISQSFGRSRSTPSGGSGPGTPAEGRQAPHDAPGPEEESAVVSAEMFRIHCHIIAKSLLYHC